MNVSELCIRRPVATILLSLALIIGGLAAMMGSGDKVQQLLERIPFVARSSPTLFEAKVTIHSAHIATYGERAVDTFYVTDLTGDKISNPTRIRDLEERMLAAADRPEAASKAA